MRCNTNRSGEEITFVVEELPYPSKGNSGEEVEIIGMHGPKGRRNLAAENLVPVYVTTTNGEPLYMANVAQLNDNDQVIGGTATNSEGVALVSGGRYRISHIGYHSVIVDVGGTGLDVQLMPNTQTLGGVTITANRPNWWPVVGVSLLLIGGLLFIKTKK